MATMNPLDSRHVTESVATGSTAEIIGGVAGVVLAILGLASVVPDFMLTIAVIAVGAALVFEGGSIAAEYSKILASTAEGRLQTADVASGMSAEMIGGIAGIVLGILALLGLATTVLSASALIVFGATLAVSSATTSRLSDVKIQASGAQQTAQWVAHEAVIAAADTQVLAGIAAGVLGILALVGIAPLTLTLVGLLTVGASVLLSGSAVGGRLMTLFRR